MDCQTEWQHLTSRFGQHFIRDLFPGPARGGAITEDDIGRHAAGTAAGSSDDYLLARSAQGATAGQPRQAWGPRGAQLTVL